MSQPPGGPVPPTNVQLVTADDEVVPVDCVFVGYEDGMALWEIVQPQGGWPARLARVTVEKFPARTSIAMPLGAG